MPAAPSICNTGQRHQLDPIAAMKIAALGPSLRTRDRGNHGEVDKEYLHRVSTGFSFTEEVVKERSYSSLPYDKKYLLEAFDISNIVSPPPKSRLLLGSHGASLAVKRHLPCNLRPLCKKAARKAVKMYEAAQKVEAVKGRETPDTEESNSSSTATFLTEGDDEGGTESNWDKLIVSILSQPTAEWIVHRQTSPGSQQEELVEALEERYGEMSHTPELIRDNISLEGRSDAGEEGGRSECTKKKWKKENETLLHRVRDLTEKKGLPTDPYCDETGAAFYRLPAGVRRARRQKQKQDDGAINRTAHDVHVIPFLPPPPPGLRESLHPGVGGKVYETTNPFQQERLIGVQQIRGLDEEDKEIVLETHNHYRKQLQERTPRDPVTWYPATAPVQPARHLSRRPKIGTSHWTRLPELIQFDYANASSGSNDEEKDIPPGQSNAGIRDELHSADPSSGRKAKNNQTLLEIVNDWRAKWNLDMRYADATPTDLIRDMADIHVHIKLKAITTCARAAEYRPPPQLGIHLDKDNGEGGEVKLLPEELFVALECCLDDENDQVTRAAAITLYTLERPLPKAEGLLRSALKEALCVDRWAAAQCLAYYGECDSEVVGELIRQLLNSTDHIHREQAAHLLAKLSENSTLVHSMLAEQLNSSSWRHRVMVCTMLPKLEGNINKDIVNKLLYLMWKDWHKEVRKAAAQSLGRTGHGKAVHDELIGKITRGTERSKLEALNKLGHLGIMTAKLLPPFLECFHSNYVSVRMEACIACSNLLIQEESVLNQLIYLTTYDAIWKVKALAIQALGKIGVITPPIRECIVWAFRYEKVSGVRAEACHSMIALRMTDKEVVQYLQDRYLVEGNDIVKEEIMTALEMCAISPTDDMDMVTQIRNEVTKMCTRNNVCRRILVIEREKAKRERMNRLIYQGKKEVEDTTKATEAKEETTETKEKMSHLVDVAIAISRPSSRDVTAADIEVQAITARSPSTTGSHTTASLSAKSRRTDKTAPYGESDTGSDATVSAASRRSTVSQLAAAAMAAARDTSGRRREQSIVENEMSEVEAGIVSDKPSGGLLAVDDVSMAIAQFFKRYDDIGIPDDDDLDRFWVHDMSVFGHCVEATDGIEAGDTEVMLPATGKGTDGAGRGAVLVPVWNVTVEAVAEEIASMEGDHEDADVDDDYPNSIHTDELTRVTGVNDGCVTPGDSAAIVDDGRPVTDGEDINVTDSTSLDRNAALPRESTDSQDEEVEQRAEFRETEEQKELESRETEEEQLEESRVTDEQQEAELRDTDREQEAESRDVAGPHQVAELHDKDEKQEADSSDVDGQKVSQSRDTEEQQDAEPVSAQE